MIRAIRTRILLIALALHLVLLLAPPIAITGRPAAVLFQTRPMACVGLLVLLSLVEALMCDRRRDTPTTSMLAKILALASSLSLLAIGWASMAGTTGSWLGALVAIVGIALRGLAIRDLGEGFTSAIHPRNTLIVEGIYGRVRHPSEVGLLMIGGGLAWLGGSWAAVVFMGVLIPSIIVRLILEERCLSKQFGDAHARYRERVGALVPILGRR